LTPQTDGGSGRHVNIAAAGLLQMVATGARRRRRRRTVGVNRRGQQQERHPQQLAHGHTWRARKLSAERRRRKNGFTTPQRSLSDHARSRTLLAATRSVERLKRFWHAMQLPKRDVKASIETINDLVL
jgi:hypothetical protein